MSTRPVRIFRHAFGPEDAHAPARQQDMEALEVSSDFSAKEANSMVGLRVVARQGLMVRPGTRGTVTDMRRYPKGWLIHVAWDGAGEVGDWLTKRESVQGLDMQRD